MIDYIEFRTGLRRTSTSSPSWTPGPRPPTPSKIFNLPSSDALVPVLVLIPAVLVLGRPPDSEDEDHPDPGDPVLRSPEPVALLWFLRISRFQIDPVFDLFICI